MFGAGDDEAAPIGIRFGGACHRANVGAGAGFGHGEAVNFFSTDARIQIFFPLRPHARLKDVAGPPDGILQRHVGAPQFPVEQTHRQSIQPAAAQLRRHVGGVKPDFPRARDNPPAQRLTYRVGFFHFFFVGIQLLFDKTPGGVHQHLLFFGGGKVHGKN